ncbi:MAG: beta-galactosidase [Paracoccaceae bacterium]
MTRHIRPELGVCYYPEHWPEEMWPADAQNMVDASLRWVRIGEFAWSRMEPTPGDLQFDWLDRAIEVLGNAGLKVVLGTPTATPPRWMLDKHPDMLAHDADGRPRNFGSRRHYCFSHAGYIDECKRITRLMGQRYGRNPHVAAWQIDNEYGCHDTTLSYSPSATHAFRDWLAQWYQSVDRLNTAWGNVFWSMEYQTFDQIDLPNLTVTQPNPAHEMDFRRFSSDQVTAFNRAQVHVLRPLTDAPLIHNYMGRVLEFDHFDVGADLEIASWDSYPIGFLSDRLDAPASHKRAFLQQGDPDMQAFHHDLYRAVGRGRWWVMEQQPGPVNWAPYNPSPLPGMVRLWTMEAVAHGAEVVSYFRWRQAPFGQEQMHAGLRTPDDRPAPAMGEIAEVIEDLNDLGAVDLTQADVALLFDYPSDWAWQTLPQGAGFDYFDLLFNAYRALRRAGLTVDILRASDPVPEGYALVLAPGLATPSEAMLSSLTDGTALALLGPRTGAITEDFQIPVAGRPAIPDLPARVERVETLPPDAARHVEGGGAVQDWIEELSSTTRPTFATQNGAPVLIEAGNTWYLAGAPDETLWDRLIAHAAETTGLRIEAMPDGLRKRVAGRHTFLFNYAATETTWNGDIIPPCGVLVKTS